VPDRPKPDREAVADAVRALLTALGQELSGELEQTPELVAGAWCDELLEGQNDDAHALLAASAIDAGKSQGIVMLRDLDVASMCPHHLLPSHGRADVLYLPGSRVAGFGAIARALRVVTRRLTLQEHAGQALVDAMTSALGTTGALCRLRLHHTCLSARGAREAQATVETIALAGSFAEGGPDRMLALSVLHGGQGG
jgi:GTP cyclohydrolase IA